MEQGSQQVLNETVLEAVISLSQKAGEAILAVYHRAEGFDVDKKGDDSPITEADLAAHAIICPGLEKILPGAPVLSEESEIPPYDERALWHRYWIVDPLDGTKEFIRRNGEFTVNIALIEEGVPVLGVVFVPVSGVSYAGLQGVGAFKQDAHGRQAISVRSMAERERQGEPVMVVASRSHGAEAVDRMLSKIAKNLGEVETRNMGSSLKLCLVAEGAADIYPRLAPTCEWDTAAAQAVVEAAGGRVLDDELRELRYNTKSDLLNPFFYVIGDVSFDWARLLS